MDRSAKVMLAGMGVIVARNRRGGAALLSAGLANARLALLRDASNRGVYEEARRA